jgi:CHAD domain-containing protein
VRDLDVLIGHFAGALAGLDGSAEAAFGLVGALEGRRAEARATLLEALASDRYFALLDALADFVAAPPLSSDSVPLADIWWGEAKRLKRAAGQIQDDSEDAELHEVRILVKRARYAAELGAHELGKRGTRFVARAKEAQDVLGAHQDAVVGESEIRAWAGDRADLVDVAERLVERERARRAYARAAWPETWERLWSAARDAHK